MPQKFLKALRDLYTAVDTDMKNECVEPWPGECQVGKNGPQPQPYLLEVNLIRQSGMVPGHDAKFGEACPFFSTGRCLIFEVRPFECRTYAGPSRSHWVHDAWRIRLDDLCADYAQAAGEPHRGYPLWLHFDCHRSMPNDWLDAT